MNKSSKKAIPERFRVARPTLLFDHFMSYFIRIGGLMVISAIAGIFIFILIQILPLFKGPSVEKTRVIQLGEESILEIGIDKWSELPMFVRPDGSIHFLDIVDMDGEQSRGQFQMMPDFEEENIEFPFVRYNHRHGNLLFGTADGRFSVVHLDYETTHPKGKERVVVPELSTTPFFSIGRKDASFEMFDYADAGRVKLAAAIQTNKGQSELYALILRQEQTLIGEGDIEVDEEFQLTELIDGDPQSLRVTGDGNFIIVATQDGRIHLIARERNQFELRQSLYPFEDQDDSQIESLNLLFGDISLILTNPDGLNRMYSLYHDDEFGARILGKTKDFAALPQGASFFSTSLRNKGFLIGDKSFVSLRYATTKSIRWQKELDFEVQHAILGGRYNRILLIDTDNRLHLYDLEDQHPQTGWKAYFGKIHYEGRAEPEFMWQSTGGSDAFEPKISMVPLIVGTLKGTIYAMMFAVPIALLGAIYTSQFLSARLRRMIKPLMEIMESVPTVVLGFLAALWLAPIIAGRVPSFLLLCIGIPITALVVGWISSLLPKNFKSWLKPGYEFLFFFPFLMGACWLCWQLGPILEQMFFVSVDPNSGERTADFRLWLTNEMGVSFEQRNALVVGFVMGFAVIPTIFTIAEDAMANVPTAFKSASLALGASRWQTAVSIVIPTAAAGIFSALMIGFGRAVGETMIVLMATGNTPVMSMNIFEGMRTLSANIAVELPEAAHGGTLYRSLFLGAMLLFLMTFFVNTLAEVMRQRLRNKYKAVE